MNVVKPLVAILFLVLISLTSMTWLRSDAKQFLECSDLSPLACDEESGPLPGGDDDDAAGPPPDDGDDDDDDAGPTPKTVVETTGLTIDRIGFPLSVGVGSSASGLIDYRQAQLGVRMIRFDVVDGRYQRIEKRVFAGQGAGQVRFTLQCSNFAQALSLRVTLQDRAGKTSDSKLLRFNCGRPPLYNLTGELKNKHPVSDTVRVHFFVLDDGVTALTEGATPQQIAPFSLPNALVVRALNDTVLPALNGIWDQCGLSFEAGFIRIVDPNKVRLAQGSLASTLFDPRNKDQFFLKTVGTSPLGQTKQFLNEALGLEDEGEAIAPEDLVVYIMGMSVFAPTQFTGSSASFDGKFDAVEGFSEVSTSSYALVRWGAVFEESKKIVLPKQAVATLAHELGHLLGLAHPGNDGLSETPLDELNLMKGSGVTPEPRANLLANQCRRAQVGLAQLRLQADTLKSNPQIQAKPPGVEDNVFKNTAPKDASVVWEGLKDEQRLRGQVVLSALATGLKLNDFGFADFTYSRDGRKFVQIGLKRDPEDGGFQIKWDTTTLPNGRYQLRVMVVDSLRQRVFAYVWINIRN